MENETYFVITDSRYNEDQTLFLVDRNKTKRKWWTTGLTQAIEFKKKDAADKAARKLIHNNARVVNKRTAVTLSGFNDRIESNRFIYDDHPFSSDALGQWE